MIKANELRCGNVIYWKNTFWAVLDRVAFAEMLANNDFSDIYPIPLTPEILDKVCIEKNHGYPYKFLVGYIKIRDGKWFFKYYNLEVEVNFVHQLQNLYHSLTGEELNINL